MQSTNEAADIITGTYGHGGQALTITYRRLTYTWTVTVYAAGTLRIEELCNAYDTKQAAWVEAQRIALAAHQGKTVGQIIDETPSELALAEVKRIVDGIQANIERATPTPVDVSNILEAAPTGGSWAAERRTAREQAARTDTSSGAHHKPLTPAEQDVVRAATTNPDGTVTVTTRPGQTWLVLQALDRRIPGQRTYRPGSARIIKALTYPAGQFDNYAEVAA